MDEEVSIFGEARRACGGWRLCSTLAPVGRTAGSCQVSPWWSSVGRFIWESVVCVAEASPGVTRRCPAKVEPIGPYVFLWAGLDQGCLRNHSGAARDLKNKGKQAILRIYGMEGEVGWEGAVRTRIPESSRRRKAGGPSSVAEIGCTTHPTSASF